MIANFFQNLSDHGVEALLISGQASVLYGAATFSEDIDLWIKPTPDNCTQFLGALRACRACYYKLTPPFEVSYLLRGHGFHFTLPGGTEPEIFLDVMGRPPRTGFFDAARDTANWIDTDWGRVLTIGVKELVELKKTQRLEDYPIISRLALVWLDRAGGRAQPADFRWAMENIFTLAELRRLVEQYPPAASVAPAAAPAALGELARQIQSGREPSEQTESEVTAWMQERMQFLQQADRAYWRGVLRELRQIRAADQLVVEGTTV